MDAHDRILDAAAECIARAGYAGATISAVAKQAGLSRPTVYAHFRNREDLVSAALKRAAAVVVGRIVEQAGRATTAADFVVEATVAARVEFRTVPALAPIAFPERADFRLFRTSMSADQIAMARGFLAPLLEYEPELGEDLDEIAELVMRLLLSLVWIDSEMSTSEDRLRDYLHRRLVPALGLPPRT